MPVGLAAPAASHFLASKPCNRARPSVARTTRPLTRMPRTPATRAHSAEQEASKKAPASASLQGKWVKDTGASDMQAMSRALDLMRLGRVQKHCALKLVTGLEIAESAQDEMVLKFVTLTPFFKPTERYALGRETEMRRRDLRSGGQRAVALQLDPKHLHVDIRWDGHLPGHVEERYAINSRGQLEVNSVMEVMGSAVPIHTVYNKAGCKQGSS